MKERKEIRVCNIARDKGEEPKSIREFMAELEESKGDMEEKTPEKRKKDYRVRLDHYNIN